MFSANKIRTGGWGAKFFAVMVMLTSFESYAQNIHAASELIQDQLLAIELAYERLLRDNIETAGKVLVVGKHRGLLTISFINAEPQYGGQTHVVYDPRTKSIVGVLAEE